MDGGRMGGGLKKEGIPAGVDSGDFVRPPPSQREEARDLLYVCVCVCV